MPRTTTFAILLFAISTSACWRERRPEPIYGYHDHGYDHDRDHGHDRDHDHDRDHP
jgi:ABC-type nickel/cobalt efflux system permease component RcnA